jgi:hypothetical protein
VPAFVRRVCILLSLPYSRQPTTSLSGGVCFCNLTGLALRRIYRTWKCRLPSIKSHTSITRCFFRHRFSPTWLFGMSRGSQYRGTIPNSFRASSNICFFFLLAEAMPSFWDAIPRYLLSCACLLLAVQHRPTYQDDLHEVWRQDMHFDDNLEWVLDEAITQVPLYHEYNATFSPERFRDFQIILHGIIQPRLLPSKYTELFLS